MILRGVVFFHFFGVGDHRGIIIDIPHQTLLGGNVLKIVRPNARRLNCNKPHVKKKYNDVLEIYCYKHRIQQKIYSLFPPIYPATDQASKAMEAIERVISEGMAHAEKKCRKIHAGEVPFSPKLAKAGRKIKLWRLVIRHKQTNRVNTITIRRVAKKCNLKRVLAVSLRTARNKLEEAWKKYKKLKKSAHRLRTEFLYEQEDKAQSQQSKRAIRMIRRHEESRRSWRSINNSQGKRRSKGISAVKVQINGVWKTIKDREPAEAAIMGNNSHRFGDLTKTTPLMSKYMREKLGVLAQNELAQTILDSSYIPDPQLDNYTNKFLSFISSRSQLPSVSAAVHQSDFISYWKGAREKTSSSLSGRHFGHYKAAASNSHLSELHASFQHVASSSGLVLSRWAKGLTIMLEKIEGNIKVDKLRAILLMEADFNFLNKLIFGHRMIKQAEAHNRMPEELYGSRACLTAILVAINRRLVIDIFKQKRRSGAIAGVDAAQCYDRIVHSLSILLCQREGAPASSLMMMFGVIQCMVYFIRTAFGDSTTSYG